MMQSIEKFVIETIHGTSKQIGDAVHIDRKTPLLEMQILDSIELLELVMQLETEYALSIPLEELAPENFTDVAAIAHMVEKQVIRGRG